MYKMHAHFKINNYYILFNKVFKCPFRVDSWNNLCRRKILKISNFIAGIGTVPKFTGLGPKPFKNLGTETGPEPLNTFF